MQAFLALLGKALAWLGHVFDGPLGGLIGGAISFLLLEMGYKRRRERHDVAEAIGAELAGIAEQLNAFLADPDLREIPLYYLTSHVVFDALASRLAELRFEDVLAVSKVYRNLDELNRMPAAWRERALNARSLPSGHPVREAELKTLEEGRQGFYGLVSSARKDCRGLAIHLRTKYTLGWRSLIPLRVRPVRRLTD